MRLLIVEDDVRLAGIIERVFSREHYLVDRVSDGRTGLDLAGTDIFDVIILDRSLPELDGVSLLRQLRDLRIDTPVLMLTAHGDVEDRVSGLRAGADDYLGKPFAIDELVARVDALVRRRNRPLAPATEQVGDIVINMSAAEVRCGDELIALSPQEYQLLELLVRNRGQVVDRATIRDRVWGFDADPQSNVVELYVHYLRRKLGAVSPSAARAIVTVRGVGYRVDEPSS